MSLALVRRKGPNHRRGVKSFSRPSVFNGIRNGGHDRNEKREKNRGMAVLYIGIAILAVFGVISLAVDVGRIRVAKGQVQTAADAAAMAAALSIPKIDLSGGNSFDFDDVDQQAVSLASVNVVTVDNVSVTLQPVNDVDYGTWDVNARTFTVLARGDDHSGDPRSEPTPSASPDIAMRGVATRCP